MYIIITKMNINIHVQIAYETLEGRSETSVRERG